MAISVAVLMITGGVCACAPLFKRAAKFLGRVLSIAGFFVGVAIIVVAIDLALGLKLLSTILAIQPVPDASSNSYLKYYLLVMAVLGVLLFSRPIRNIRWASLISLGAGIVAAAFLRVVFVGLSTTVLAIVFVIAAVIVYMLLRLVEDVLEFVGQVLAFPPIAVAVGLVSIYFGILTYGAT